MSSSGAAGSANGRFEIKQSAFGIADFVAAVVSVKDAIGIDFDCHGEP